MEGIFHNDSNFNYRFNEILCIWTKVEDQVLKRRMSTSFKKVWKRYRRTFDIEYVIRI